LQNSMHTKNGRKKPSMAPRGVVNFFPPYLPLTLREMIIDRVRILVHRVSYSANRVFAQTFICLS
jgi:hypothetical protein